jgi:hypothetical protein
VLSVGIAYFFFHHFKNPYMLFIGGVVIGCVGLYVDFGKVIRGLTCGKRNKVDAPPDTSDTEIGGADKTEPTSTAAPSIRSTISPECCPTLQYHVSHYDEDSNSEVISVVSLCRAELNPPPTAGTAL